MPRSVAPALAAAIALVLTSSSSPAQQVNDHLLVYKIRAAPALAVDYSMDLAAMAPELAALGCRVRSGSRTKHLLAPVDKRNVTPAPPNPEIRGQDLTADYLCYKLECPARDPAVRFVRRNQLASHSVAKVRARRICVPSQTSAPPTTVPTCGGDGASCAAGDACCDGLFCCEGIPVPPGQEFCGSVCPISDRERKENFAPVDPADVLGRLALLDITSWNYKTEGEGIRHLGPMAQDFRRAFRLGSSDEAIFLVDADGVALAAIQALNSEVESLRDQNANLRDNLESIEARLADVEAR